MLEEITGSIAKVVHGIPNWIKHQPPYNLFKMQGGCFLGYVNNPVVDPLATLWSDL